jgi:excisionase family DNA binding protein
MQHLSKHTRIPVPKVAERFGVHVRTIERWIEDTDLQFPRPVYIRRRRYIKADELRAWEEQQPDRLGTPQN